MEQAAWVESLTCVISVLFGPVPLPAGLYCGLSASVFLPHRCQFWSRISFLPGPPRLYIVLHTSCLKAHMQTYNSRTLQQHTLCREVLLSLSPEEKAAFDLACGRCLVTWHKTVAANTCQDGGGGVILTRDCVFHTYVKDIRRLAQMFVQRVYSWTLPFL